MQINAKSRQLHWELKCITKGNKTIEQYLGRIQQIADILESIGDPVLHRDQLETIFDGLPPEYQALTSIIQYCDEPCEIIIAETMLLSHEARLDRSTHAISHGSLFVNLTQGMIPLAQDSSTSIVSDPTS